MIGHLTKFDQIIDKVLKHEGGYVNDPNDPGGETNFGISKRAYPNVDIKNLTIDGAKEIYKKDYWDKTKVESVPERLRYIYFDMCVNMGMRRAVKTLQNAANNKNSNKIDVDGFIGPNTIKALSNIENERVRSYRIMYYADLITKKPTLEKFWFGWYRRASEV